MPMPTIETKKFRFRYIIYGIIAFVCMISIGIAVYMQYFTEEKLGVIVKSKISSIFNIKMEEENAEQLRLKENFLNLNIFTNNIDTIEQYSGSIQKIREEEDILLTEEIKEKDAGYTLDLKIPYYNINSEDARIINNEIRSTFKEKSNSVINSTGSKDIVFNVKYKAYMNNNILSLVILSELKEENTNQRIIIQTYNYDLTQNRKVTIDQIVKLKNIDIDDANSKIKEEIKASQEENIKLRDMGYGNAQVRDYNSDIYKITNAEQFFIGENGYLYIVYPYGNTELTSEMNVIILE